MQLPSRNPKTKVLAEYGMGTPSPTLFRETHARLSEPWEATAGHVAQGSVDLKQTLRELSEKVAEQNQVIKTLMETKTTTDTRPKGDLEAVSPQHRQATVVLDAESPGGSAHQLTTSLNRLRRMQCFNKALPVPKRIAPALSDTPLAVSSPMDLARERSRALRMLDTLGTTTSASTLQLLQCVLDDTALPIGFAGGGGCRVRVLQLSDI